MAQVIRRHWQLALLNLVLAFAGIGLLCFHILKSPAKASAATASVGNNSDGSAPTPVSTLDLKTFLRIRQLRERMALRNTDLAAMGCTQAQSTQILSALVAWASANAATWTQMQNNQVSTLNALASAQRQINIGPADPVLMAKVPTLRQNLATAQQQFDQFFQPANDAVSSLLSAGQQRVWVTAKQNMALKVPERYRYASGITADQAKVVILAVYRGQSGDSLLPFTASQDLQAADQKINRGIVEVMAAETAVLPVPKQLQPRRHLQDPVQAPVTPSATPGSATQ